MNKNDNNKHHQRIQKQDSRVFQFKWALGET